MKINDINPMDFAAYVNERFRELTKQASVQGEVKPEHEAARARLEELKQMAWWTAQQIFPGDEEQAKRHSFLRMTGVKP